MDGVDDCRMFFIAFCQFNTDFDMTPFHFVVDRLADVMHQPRASCKLDVFAEFTRKHSCKISDFNRMFEHILTVAQAVLHLTEMFYKFRMEIMDIKFEC